MVFPHQGMCLLLLIWWYLVDVCNSLPKAYHVFTLDKVITAIIKQVRSSQRK